MSINSVNNLYGTNGLNNANGASYQNNAIDLNKMASSVFAPFNKVFDEVVFSNHALNGLDSKNTQEINEEKMKVIAHRGYSEKAPENTIPAFIMAAKNGYTTVECDLEWTKDGVPVILHDSTINRTARRKNGWPLIFPKNCSKMTYDELLKYDFGSWFSDDFKGTKIPSFSELLECAGENDLNLYVELKETADFDDKKAKILADLAKKAGLEDKITWISFNSDYLKKMADAMPSSRLGYLTKKDVDKNTIDTLNGLKTGQNEVFLDVKSTKISKESSKLLDEAGFDFEAWTVDNEDEIKNLESYDCKGVTTNKITEDDIKDYFGP